jgi:putative copper export protein
MIAALVNLAAFAGLTVAIGAVVMRFAILGRSSLSATERAPAARHAARGAYLGTILLLLSAVTRVITMSRELAGPGESWMPMLRTLVMETATGKAIALQAIWAGAATLAFASARTDRERGWRAAGLSVFVLALTPGMLGHHANVEPRTLALAAASVHVLAAGSWIGGLFHLWRSSRVASEATLVRMVGAFHLVAFVAVTCLAVTGVLHTLSLVGDAGNLLSTRWGQTLLLKLTLVAGTLVLGYRHWRTASALIRAGRRQAVSKSMGREVMLAIAVLVVTGLLTVTAPPE